MALNQQSAQIPVSGTYRLPAANFFFLIAASANVAVTLSVGGQTEIFQSAIAGLKLKRLKRWDYIDIAAPAGTTINYLIGYTAVQADDTDIQQALATIAGTVAVAALPSSTIADDAPISPTVAGQHVLFAANLGRRRITVWSDPANAGDATIFLRKTGGANDIGFITPGIFIEFDTIAGMDYRAPIGGDKLYLMEET